MVKRQIPIDGLFKVNSWDMVVLPTVSSPKYDACWDVCQKILAVCNHTFIMIIFWYEIAHSDLFVYRLEERYQDL